MKFKDSNNRTSVKNVTDRLIVNQIWPIIYEYTVVSIQTFSLITACKQNRKIEVEFFNQARNRFVANCAKSRLVKKAH